MGPFVKLKLWEVASFCLQLDNGLDITERYYRRLELQTLNCVVDFKYFKYFKYFEYLSSFAVI